MSYGNYLKELIDKSGISETSICKTLDISSSYLHSIFDGQKPPLNAAKQVLLINLLSLSENEFLHLCDMATMEQDHLTINNASYMHNNINKNDKSEIYKNSYQEILEIPFFPSSCSNNSSTQKRLKVPCCYQGGKQRVAKEIVDSIYNDINNLNTKTQFFDVCCGSGAFTIELLNRGIDPERITMIDISSWGAFWEAIGSGTFSIEKFIGMLNNIPDNKSDIKTYMIKLAHTPINDDECYLYPILQACSFGGKQIWREGNSWKNAFFRSYWEPSSTSKRQSPANPMQPSPSTLASRVIALVDACIGINCLHADVNSLFNLNIPDNSVIYIDPPYKGTTGYAYGFDLNVFIEHCQKLLTIPTFVSEGFPLSENSKKLEFRGPKGGISGNKKQKHEEWLTRII